ncbi:hypothetical protein CCACVL1_18320 [Corchorus capsularis]|uniref:Uncharacterized protein n=1 Tax=Corchorus capsularis TaxID=210143 RepID=A0A1R3HM11_COCAP|nr:hypothetical protein CCACVL1_18320 [Corchorus capsularis]
MANIEDITGVFSWKRDDEA